MANNPLEQVSGFSAGAAAAMVARSLGAAPGFWSQKVKTASLTRTNPARSADPDIALTVAAGAIYVVRGMLFFTAEAGGPTFQYRWTGPAAPTLVNLKVGGSAGAITAGAITGSATPLLGAFDAADRNLAVNTGGPATAFGWISLDGMFIPSIAGTFALEWTGSNVTFGVTLLRGSYLEYRRIG